MEEKQEQPKEDKKPSLLWPLLLWPLVGVPVFWILVGLFWVTLSDLGELNLAPASYSVMVTPFICFGIGAWVGARFARRSLPPGKMLSTALLVGCSTAILGSVYNFGACALFIPFA